MVAFIPKSLFAIMELYINMASHRSKIVRVAIHSVGSAIGGLEVGW